METFRQKIYASKRASAPIIAGMISFSNRLQHAMDLQDHDLEEADHENITWDIPGFNICVRSFPWNRWVRLLVAAPAGTAPDMIGYSNRQEAPPKHWHYIPSGTATVFLPPECIQNEIISRIKGA